jgi:hypothetical protein
MENVEVTYDTDRINRLNTVARLRNAESKVHMAVQGCTTALGILHDAANNLRGADDSLPDDSLPDGATNIVELCSLAEAAIECVRHMEAGASDAGRRIRSLRRDVEEGRSKS